MKRSILHLRIIVLAVSLCVNNYANAYAVTVFVTIPIFPIIEVLEYSDEFFAVNLTNNKNKKKQVLVDKNPGEIPIIDNKFFSKYCDQSVLIVILKQDINTGVSHGSFYSNIVIDIQNGALIKIIEAGKVNDKQTNEIISNDQKNVISALKSNSSKEQKCSK